MANKPNLKRYQRQIILNELGESGQQKLQNAKVLVIGAGGLGSPALQYLCGVGIGTLGIMDHDVVSLSNLHRQTIFSTDDIGISKLSRAAEILSALNPEIEILNCEEAGVLGVLPGIIETMMANEAIKLITGIGKPLINKILNYNSLNNQIYTVELQSRTETRFLIPNDINEFQKTNYQWLCSNSDEYQIDLDFFRTQLTNLKAMFIDVREINEVPIINEFDYINIPMSEFKHNLDKLDSETVILFCQSGKRSLNAAKMVTDYYGDSKKVYSLRGGIIEWKNLKDR